MEHKLGISSLVLEFLVLEHVGLFTPSFGLAPVLLSALLDAAAGFPYINRGGYLWVSSNFTFPTSSWVADFAEVFINK